MLIYINIIIGNNAQGKTSLIESIYVLSTTKSHRTSKDSQLILFNEDFARIEADITRERDDLHLSLVISKKGKKFYGCSNYPQCDFAAPGIPTGDKCPECGGFIPFSSLFLSCRTF